MRKKSASARPRVAAARPVEKCPTGISGLDQITTGGLPRGRPTLVCGSAGCGKTLLGMEFLIRGILEYGEPGVCMSFEETAGELAANVASLGFDANALIAAGKLSIDYVHIDRNQIEETGEYNLDGLFIRLNHAIDSVGAKRVLLDTIESLFSGLSNELILRNELRRLFRWLKEKGVTAVVTAERGDGTLTRHGLEEYISDCVILLDHRVEKSVFTRRLRVVKYRGSTHGTNEYPFLIDQQGISVLPVTSVALEHPALNERVSSGIRGLDEMLEGKGFYRGSTVLISGTPGTGKTSLGAHFVKAAVDRNEKALVFAFEESRDQWVRNMTSIGLNLSPAIKKGLLGHESFRPTTFGLEMHLVHLHKHVEQFQPSVVFVDPISALVHAGATEEVSSVLLRLVDYLKSRGITTVLSMLLHGANPNELEHTALALSSMVDTWVLLRDIETAGERNRGLYVLKSRGMAHSNQIREYGITPGGIVLREAYLGPEGVLTGSARVAQESRDKAAESARQWELEIRRLEIDRKQKAIEAQIAVLRAESEAEAAQLRRLMDEENSRLNAAREVRDEIAVSRHAETRPKSEAGANGGRSK
jgi:circadian clock protein KaiC